jgi:ankyrin repeat protein
MLYKSGYHDSAITPLQVAINSGNEEMVKLLRSYGAKDVSGQTLEKLERLQRIMTEMEDTIAEGWAQIDSHLVDGRYVGDVEAMESIQKKLCRIREEVLKLAKSADLTDWEKRVYEVNSDNVNHQVMFGDCGLNIRGKVSDLIPDS